jgi:hypothetical protein
VVQDKLIIGNDECGVGVELLTIIGIVPQLRAEAGGAAEKKGQAAEEDKTERAGATRQQPLSSTPIARSMYNTLLVFMKLFQISECAYLKYIHEHEYVLPCYCDKTSAFKEETSCLDFIKRYIPTCPLQLIELFSQPFCTSYRWKEKPQRHL